MMFIFKTIADTNEGFALPICHLSQRSRSNILKICLTGLTINIFCWRMFNVTLVNVYVDLASTWRFMQAFRNRFEYLDDRYSNLFLNAYINRHAHTQYLKMI